MKVFYPGISPMGQAELDAYVEHLPPLTPADETAKTMAIVKGSYSDLPTVVMSEECWRHSDERVRQQAVITYAEAWGRLAEEVACEDGEEVESFEETLKHTAVLANCSNIPPELFKKAAEYLATFWLYREYMDTVWGS